SFVPGLAGSGNRVEAPDLLTRVHVEGSEETADTVFAAGDAGDHLILDDERRDRHRVLLLVVRDLDVPKFFAGLCIERDHFCIEAGEKELVAEDGDAAGEVAAAGIARAFGRLMRVLPDGL